MQFNKYLYIALGLGLSYAAITYLSNKPSNPKNTKKLDYPQTLKLLQQVKHQIMIICISFADGVSKGMNQRIKDQSQKAELDKYFRGELVKIYESKEALILEKYATSKEDFAAGLKTHGNDKVIKQHQAEMLDMMERSIQGLAPIFTIPQQAKKFTKDRLKILYKEMCVMIATRIWEKLEDSKAEDPSFNPKDDACFKKAIRQINIYDFKNSYLEERGFKKSWGTPNEIFFKSLQSQKTSSASYKAQMTKIQKGYQKLIEEVSKNPEDITREQIAQIMEQHLNPLPPAVPILPQMQQQVQPLKRSFGGGLAANPVQQQMKVEQPKKASEEEDIEAMMMAQLIQRSTVEEPKKIEQPKEEEKKQEANLDQMMMNEMMNRKEQPKVEEPVQQVKQEETVQAKPQQVQVVKQQEQVQEVKQEEQVKEVKQEEPVQQNKQEQPVKQAIQEPVQQVSKEEQPQQPKQQGESIVENKPEEQQVENKEQEQIKQENVEQKESSQENKQEEEQKQQVPAEVHQNQEPKDQQEQNLQEQTEEVPKEQNQTEQQANKSEQNSNQDA